MKTILLTGRTGQVGHELISALAPVGRVVAVGRDQLDLSDPDSITGCVREVRPDIIVNAGAYTAVDDAEAEPDLAMRVNADAPAILAEEAKRSGALLLHYSTDYVFDGRKAGFYTEEDSPNPLNAYGRSKLAGEQRIVASGCRHLIFRTSWLYADRGTNFLLTMLELAKTRKQMKVVDDQIGSPTWARTLAETSARTLLHPALDSRLGIYHLSAPGHVTRYEFAAEIIRLAETLYGGSWTRIEPCSTLEFPRPAARPLNAATSKERFTQAFGFTLPDWTEQLRDCMSVIMDRAES